MRFRLGTLLLLSSGCATVSLDENAARIDNVIRAQDPIPEPLALGEHEPMARGSYNNAFTHHRRGSTVAIGPVGLPPERAPVATADAPEGYRWVNGRRGPRLMRQPGYIGVEIGEVRTGDVDIDTGAAHGIRVTSGR